MREAADLAPSGARPNGEGHGNFRGLRYAPNPGYQYSARSAAPMEATHPERSANAPRRDGGCTGGTALQPEGANRELNIIDRARREEGEKGGGESG